jgi:hypothetical protein
MVSRRQTLLDWLVDAAGPLKQITTGNGYNFTAGLVQRGQRSLNDLNESDYPCLFVAETDEKRSLATHNQFLSDLRVVLLGGIKIVDGVSGAQAQLDLFIADVTKALETDRLQGGRVTQTIIERIETDAGDIESHVAFAMTVNFKYVTEGITP